MLYLLLYPFFGCNIWGIDQLLQKCSVYISKTLKGKHKSKEAHILGNIQPL